MSHIVHRAYYFRNFANNFRVHALDGQFHLSREGETESSTVSRDIDKCTPDFAAVSVALQYRLWQSHRELHRQEAIKYSAM